MVVQSLVHFCFVFGRHGLVVTGWLGRQATKRRDGRMDGWTYERVRSRRLARKRWSSLQACAAIASRS